MLQGIQDFSNGTGALDNRMVQAKGETLGAYSARPIVPGVPNLGAVDVTEPVNASSKLRT